jgi:hypothetical protein
LAGIASVRQPQSGGALVFDPFEIHWRPAGHSTLNETLGRAISTSSAHVTRLDELERRLAMVERDLASAHAWLGRS